MIDNLADYVTRAAHKDPERLALVMGPDRMSYGELEELTNRGARLLRDQGCATGARVCVVGAKSPSTIASLIAVLKAGGVYVPIDSASPAARVGRIVGAADPEVVLVDGSATSLIDDLIEIGGMPPDVRIGGIASAVDGTKFRTGFAQADAAAYDATSLSRFGRSSDVAHLLFTSGSTGLPKGVVITHANVIAFIDWAVEYFGTKASDRLSAHPPLHFDLSTYDMYGTFAAGAELHPVPTSLAMNPHALAAFMRDAELTQWFSVPSVLTYLAKFDAVAQDDFPFMERLLWCGDVLPTPVLTHWMKRLPHVRFTNLYGPTEATIASSYYTIPQIPATKTEPIPIGTACAGEELLVLDAELMPVPVGEIGELYIGGSGLSPGYWRDEKQTAQRFIPDRRRSGARLYRTGDLARIDLDGLVQFCGRSDSQIKSRGYRIELGEIEAAVNATAGVRECAAIGVEAGGFEGTTICCAFSTLDGHENPVDVRAVRRAVATLLPAYMVPARWRIVDALPKNVNGKIDRTAVRENFMAEMTGRTVGR